MTWFSYATLGLTKFINTRCIGAHFNNASIVCAIFNNVSLDGSYLYKSEFLPTLFMDVTIKGATTQKIANGIFIESMVGKSENIDFPIFHRLLYKDRTLEKIDQIYKEDGEYHYYYNRYSLFYADQQPEDIYSLYHYHGEPADPPNKLEGGLTGGVLKETPLISKIIAKNWDIVEELESK